MADMGLAGMAGAGGAGDAINTIFQQRMAAAESQRRQQAVDQNDALTRLKIQEQADAVRQHLEGQRQAEKDRADAAKATEQDRADRSAASTFAMNPVGSDLGSTQGPRAQALGFPVQKIAGPQVQQTSGFMPLPSAPSQGPGMQTVEGLTPINGPQAPAGQTTTTTDTQSPLNAPAMFKRGATQADVDKQDTADARVEAARQAAEARTNDNEQKAKDRLAQIAAAAAARPVADKLTKVEHKDPTTGRTVIEWLPQSQLGGKTFEKGASGTTENRLASAEAVQQTGGDIIAQLSDPKVVAAVGPAMGRASSLRDFIGNPPPEFSELAGSIESYALASMGVHGMRSSQGAEQIKKLLDAHHTPESLIAAIKGLNKFSQHFMENEGRGGTPASPTTAAPSASGAPQAPAGWKYVPKAGGGWTAVKATP